MCILQIIGIKNRKNSHDFKTIFRKFLKCAICTICTICTMKPDSPKQLIP